MKENKVDGGGGGGGGGEGDSEIGESIPFEEDYHDSMEGKVMIVILKRQYATIYQNTQLS